MVHAMIQEMQRRIRVVLGIEHGIETGLGQCYSKQRALAEAVDRILVTADRKFYVALAAGVYGRCVRGWKTFHDLCSHSAISRRIFMNHAS